MAQSTFGRKWLAAIIRNEDLSPEEKENQIMEGHIGVTDGLKDRIEELKAKADTADELQKQIDGINGGENWQEKYQKEHQAFEDFRKRTESEAETGAIKTEYRKLLVSEGISEKRIDAIMKVTDFSKMKRDKDGNLVDESDLRKSINSEWGEFKVTVAEKGATVETPPKTGTNAKTKEEIMAIKDTAKRQQAIAENLNLFGKG